MVAVVVYTEALEAITVLDLPEYLATRLHAGDTIEVPVLPSMGTMPRFPSRRFVETETVHLVRLYGLPFHHKGTIRALVFTDDKGGVMRLRSGLLPGQRPDSPPP